jgi:hypothetical protein
MSLGILLLGCSQNVRTVGTGMTNVFLGKIELEWCR